METASVPALGITIVAPFRRYLLFRFLPLAALAAFGVVWTALEARNRGLYAMVAAFVVTAVIATFGYYRQKRRVRVMAPVPLLDCEIEPPLRTLFRGVLASPSVVLFLVLEIVIILWGDPSPAAVVVGIVTGLSLVFASVFAHGWWRVRRNERSSPKRIFLKLSPALNSGKLVGVESAGLFFVTPLDATQPD